MNPPAHGASPPQRSSQKAGKLTLAVAVFLVALANLWVVDSARSYQARYLEGCWPPDVVVDGNRIQTSAFWADTWGALDLNPVERFYYSRPEHRPLFYWMVFLSLVGWSGSFFLRVVRMDDGDVGEGGEGIPTWAAMMSSALLSGIAAGILYLLVIGGRLSVDPAETGCVSSGYVSFASVAALGCGLFVVLFFDWFRGFVEEVWDRFKSPPVTPGGA